MKTNRQASLQAMIAVLMSGVLCAAAAEESSFELVAGYHGLSPKKSADWKDAAGIEIQGRFWQNEHLGFALVGASDTWKARTEVVEEDTGDTYFYTSVSGDASVTSLGASLLYRSESSAEVKLVLDIGLRYALIDSAVYGEAAYDGPGGPNYLYEKINIEDTLLFVLGAGLEFEMSRNVSLILGVGYQVDLNKPEETFAGESLGETGLDAVTYGILLSCRF
jgi:opacity protein-like surface antigen